MLSVAPPQSTAERQRRFQASHPGYDRRRKAAARAMEKRGGKAFLAKLAEAERRARELADPDGQLLLFPAMLADAERARAAAAPDADGQFPLFPATTAAA